MKYHDQGNLQKEEFINSYTSRSRVRNVEEGMSTGSETCIIISSANIRTESELEVGKDYKVLHSTPSNHHSLARLRLQKFSYHPSNSTTHWGLRV